MKFISAINWSFRTPSETRILLTQITFTQNKMAEVTFEDCWTHFKSRIPPRYRTFADIIKREYSSKLQNSTSMLGIGPAHGDLDTLLLQEILPGVTRYYGVECEADLIETLHKRIAAIKDRNIQVKISQGFFEQYSGPADPVDLVLMSGVGYYIQDKKSMMDRVMSWLKPGGHFIMIHIPPNTPIVVGQEPIRTNCPGNIDAAVNAVALCAELGIPFSEFSADFDLDVTNAGLDKVLRILLHRIPTKEETEEFSKALGPYIKMKNGRPEICQPWQIVVASKQ